MLKYNDTSSPLFGLLLLSALLLILFLIDLQVGTFDISLQNILHTLIGIEENLQKALVIEKIRLPKTLMAIVVGAALAMAGCLLQTLLNNPMASPFSLGVSSAAAFGAAIAILTSFSIPLLSPSLTVAFGSFVAASLSSLILYWFVSKTRANGATLILVGILINFTFQSGLSAAQFYASPEDLAQITFWMFGSLERASYSKVLTVFFVILTAIFFTIPRVWSLTGLRQGDERAEANGIPLKKVRLQFLLVASLLTSIAISFVGIIGFIGIISPHIARSIFGEDHRYLIPSSMLLGASLMVSASILSKVVNPGVIFPIGIVTALVGVPLMLVVLVRNQGELWN
ncbi:FecCD family ABC transporter permease [Thaumasiovibrio sp. DFM-14]|uniref:FecCD family ABC transporter permease n=1 Tax=Thaumasiovibrio sp. DFM-14 TaxID=3384792 RepID=UPI0039A34484